MLIIPEIEQVVILTPRTGSRTLKNALLKRYPRSFLLYRHMEADGIPAGYDQWAKIGVVRDPIDRLWSLFKYLEHFGEKWGSGNFCPVYVQAMRDSVKGVSFSDWVLNNSAVFTDPYSSDLSGKFWPEYNVLHRLPENKKSQWIYLRPDLGTEVIPYTSLAEVERRLDVDLHSVPRQNQTGSAPCIVTPEALSYIGQVFAWDIATAWAQPEVTSEKAAA